jgi:hypothetical protein
VILMPLPPQCLELKACATMFSLSYFSNFFFSNFLKAGQVWLWPHWHHTISEVCEVLWDVVLRQTRSREVRNLYVGCPGTAQTTLTWLGTAQAPPYSLIIG